MAYITPNSDVILCKGVPLDKDYNHTLYNTNAEAQWSTIQYYREYTLPAQSYQRYSRNQIRVDKKADDLYDCNYMMFRNTSYGNKWFYAFITEILYINDNCTQLTYEIDEMQTWYFDYEMGQCFVEREHTETDDYDEHLVPEELETGELIPQDTWEFTYPDSINPQSPMYELVVFYVPNNTKGYITGMSYEQGDYVFTISPCKIPGEQNSYNTGNILNGIYMGCKYWSVGMFLGQDINETKAEIDALINKIIGSDVQGTIVNIVQVPWQLWFDWTASGGTPTIRDSNHTMQTAFYNTKHTSSYTPKNKKMYTHPYRSIMASNNVGQSNNYKWEYFSATNQGNKQATFKIMGVPVMSPEIMCYPYNYRGITNDYETGIVLNDFPTPPWSEDSFAKWWAQNKEAYIMSLVSTAVVSIASIIAGAATANPVAVAGGVLSLGSKVSSSIGSLASTTNAPDQMSGQVNASSLRTIQNRIGYKFYDMGVEKDKAEVIDNFFSMFGYAIKKIKLPNVRNQNAHLRPHWNYIKTNGCILHGKQGQTAGGLPADAEANIAKIYDKGITFWSRLDEIGNYSLNNEPV